MRVRYKVVPKRPFSLARTGLRLARFCERVDRFEDGAYRRLVYVERKPVLLEVRQKGPPSKATLLVTLRGETARHPRARIEARNVLDRVLGVRVGVRPFYDRFRDDALLAPWIGNHLELRVVGRLHVWETLLQIVLSQQINLALAHGMLSDLVERFGRRARIEGERWFVFPTPRRFAVLSVAELRACRLSRAKASTLIGLARAFESGELSDETLRDLADEDAVELLMSFHGVGRWTAEFTLLRGLSRMDVFPAGDLGVIKYLAREISGQRAPAPEADMRRFAERWRPYRGLALIYAYAELAARQR